MAKASNHKSKKGKPARNIAPKPVRAIVLANDIVEESRRADWYSVISERHFKGGGIKNPDTDAYMNAETALVWAASKYVPPERKQALAARAVEELAKIAFSDIREAFSESGGVVNPADLEDEISAAITSIEVVTRTLPNQGEESPVEYTHKFKLADKMRALDSFLKMNGDFVEKHELTGKDGAPIETKDVSDGELAFNILRILKKAADSPEQQNEGAS